MSHLTVIVTGYLRGKNVVILQKISLKWTSSSVCDTCISQATVVRTFIPTVCGLDLAISPQQHIATQVIMLISMMGKTVQLKKYKSE